jgi:hypothetical protein
MSAVTRRKGSRFRFPLLTDGVPTHRKAKSASRNASAVETVADNL